MQRTMSTKLVRFVVPGILPLAIAVLLACPVAARATTFAVNTTIDATDVAPGDGSCETAPGNGVCTLRAAVEETNALAGADVVTVPAGIYSPVSGALIMSDDVTVAGAGAATTVIDGCGPAGGIVVAAAAMASVAGVSIRHCNAAAYGAISNWGTLTLSDSVVSDNPVSGIYNEGTLTVERVTVRRNTAAGVGGGGIASSINNIGTAPLTVVDSTIADNVSGFFGGGILVAFGTATIMNTTVSGNTAVYGGGISVGACALGCSSATMMLDNVTVTNNSVSTGDGGGVAVLGDGSILTMRNTVVAGNSDQGGQAPDCGTGGVMSEGYNLIGNATGCFVYGDGTGNLIGVGAQLGPLQDNGGPTPTHAPLAGSPLIDAGNPAVPGSGGTACEALDQRGVTRPQGARCDIGAVEAGGTPTTTSTTTSSTTSTTLPPFCAATPRADCDTALPAKASLLIKDRSDDARDRIAWKWRSNGPVTTADFGSPTTTSDYAVCVYDQSGAGSTLRMEAMGPAGGLCAGKPCWKGLTTGFLYADRELTPDGLRTIRLHAGDAGDGTITVKGRGAPLPLPTLPLGVPVTVQLQQRDGPTCWSATFSVPATNTADQLKAKGD